MHLIYSLCRYCTYEFLLTPGPKFQVVFSLNVNVNIKSSPSQSLFCFILFSWNHKNKRSTTSLKTQGYSYPREVDLKTIKPV
jgi:nitrous oxide reductase accessory protein NosL